MEIAAGYLQSIEVQAINNIRDKCELFSGILVATLN